MTERLDRFWIGVAATLLIVAVAGILVFLLRQEGTSPLVFEPPTAPSTVSGRVFVSGAVANPGQYPLKPDDTVNSLIDAAGGTTGSGATSVLSLVVRPGETDGPQKVDINRAEPWLLESVPGIGPVAAGAIVAYRNEHGPYRMVQDLLNVKGIGDTTLQRIVPYLTVGE